MQRNPITDKELGINVDREISFADVRQRAIDEYIDHKKGIKHKKKIGKELKILSPGTFVVLVFDSYNENRGYMLVEIIDYNLFDDYRHHITYYGIVKKVSKEKLIPRIGHLTYFDNRYSSWNSDSGSLSKLKEKDIKWL